MMVLNAIYSQPDLYNTLIYGIEGEDYTKNADGTITTSYVGASPTADDSYGIQAAKPAGIPDRVIPRAREILKDLESGAPERAKPAAAPVSDQVSMLDMQSDELRRALEAITVETLTPIEALNQLYQLKQLL